MVTPTVADALLWCSRIGSGCQNGGRVGWWVSIARPNGDHPDLSRLPRRSFAVASGRLLVSILGWAGGRPMTWCDVKDTS